MTSTDKLREQLTAIVEFEERDRPRWPNRWTAPDTVQYRCTAGHVGTDVEWHPGRSGGYSCFCRNTAHVTFPEDKPGSLVHEALTNDKPGPITCPKTKAEYKIDDRIRAIVVPGGMVLIIDSGEYWENEAGENYTSSVTSEFLPGATVEQFEAIYGAKS